MHAFVYKHITMTLKGEWIIGTYVIISVFVGINSEIFTSLHNMKVLYEAETEIIPLLEDYMKSQEHGVADLKLWIQEMRERRNFTHEKIEFLGHPVNAFNLIKSWWNPIARNRTGLKVAREKLGELGVAAPDHDDYIGALESLLRLQHVYELLPEDIMAGNIGGVTSLRPLEEFDYWALGFRAYDMEEYGLAVIWLFKVFELRPPRVPRDHVHKRLSDAFNKIGYFEWAAHIAQVRHDEDPGNIEAFEEMNKLAAERIEKTQQGLTPKYTAMTWRKPDYNDAIHDYEALCKGENVPRKEKRHGFCRFKTGKLPYVVYKEEIMNFAPFISVFYDVIGDEEIQQIRRSAEGHLARGMVGIGHGRSGTSNVRISKLGWVYDSSATAVKDMSVKVGDITRLLTINTEKEGRAEAFQVVNYGIGGQYAPHHDYFEKGQDVNATDSILWNTGQRVATFLFYLGTTVAGGSTVFPSVGVRVPAVKGSAALWYNLKRSGERDVLTYHAGCPVLLGEKWIANKWIRERSQFDVHKCCLDEEAAELEAETNCF